MNKIVQRVTLAIGLRELEDYLKNVLSKEFDFVGTTVSREGIIRAVSQNSPDIVIIRETLTGQDNIMDIVYDVTIQFPETRIVFLAGDREPGDALLAALVSYGVYDILYGSKTLAHEIVGLIRKGNTRKDVAHLQPKPVHNEKQNTMLFENPDISKDERLVVQEVVKEVYVDPENREEEGIPTREPIFVAPKQPKKKQKKEKKEVLFEVEDDSVGQFEEMDDILESIEQKPPLAEPSPVLHVAPEPTPVQPVREPVFASEPTPPVQEKKKSFIPNILAKPESQAVEPAEKESKFSFQIGQSKEGGAMITFMGAKNGVGTTSIAISVASALAEKHRVLYVEMNDKMPATPYWYEISSLTQGIEVALDSIAKERYQDIQKQIMSIKEMKKDATVQTVHKRFPENLDLLTFSKRYVARKSGEYEEADYSQVKDLYLYLLFQTDYDYVVLDVPPDYTHPSTHYALMYSQRIFMLLTQDVSTIGQADSTLHELEKSGYDIRKKTEFLLNKHDNSSLSVKDIGKWLKVRKMLTLPNANKEFIHSSFNGMTMYAHGRSSQWKNIWKSILKSI